MLGLLGGGVASLPASLVVGRVVPAALHGVASAREVLVR
jgi:hypothetical protein